MTSPRYDYSRAVSRLVDGPHRAISWPITCPFIGDSVAFTTVFAAICRAVSERDTSCLPGRVQQAGRSRGCWEAGYYAGWRGVSPLVEDRAEAAGRSRMGQTTRSAGGKEQVLGGGAYDKRPAEGSETT